MTKLMEMWQQNYSDMPLEEFASRVHQKHYSDMPFEEFKAKALGPAAIPKPELSKFTPDEEAYLDQRAKRLDTRTTSILPEALRDFNEQAMGAVPFANSIFDASTALFDGPKDASIARTYELNREARRRRTEMLRERSPIASTAGEIVGGVGALPASAAGTAARGAAIGWAAPRAPTSGVGQAVSAGVGRLTSPATGGTWGGRVAENTINGALVGGAQAGLQEYGYGGDGGDAAAGGAAIGAILPNALGAAGRVAGLARDVTQAFTNPDAVATRRVMDRATPVSRTPESLYERAARVGDGAMPIDFATDAGRVAMRSAINSGVQEGNALKAKLGRRQMFAGNRVSRSLAENTGADPRASEGALGIRLEQMRTEGQKAYKAAEDAAQPVDLSPTIAKIDELLGPAAEAASPGKPSKVEAALKNLRDKLTAARDRGFDLATLHRYVKRDIDEAVADAVHPVNGNKVLAGHLKEVSDQFVKDLGTNNELYTKARQQWAGDMAAIDAYRAGLEFFSSKGSNLTREELARFSKADREMLKQGMVRSVQDWIEQGVDGADISKRIMGSAARRGALAELFDTPAQRARFVQDLLNEARFARTRQKAIGGSQTDELAKEGGNALVDAMNSAAQGLAGIGQYARRMLSTATGLGWPPRVASSFIRMMSDTSMTSLQRNQRMLQLAAGNRRMYEQMRQMANQFGRRAGAAAIQTDGDD